MEQEIGSRLLSDGSNIYSNENSLQGNENMGSQRPQMARHVSKRLSVQRLQNGIQTAQSKVRDARARLNFSRTVIA